MKRQEIRAALAEIWENVSKYNDCYEAIELYEKLTLATKQVEELLSKLNLPEEK